VSIILSLFRGLEGDRRSRLVAKFVENEFEKVVRMLELHDHYAKVVAALDSVPQRFVAEDEEQRLLDRLDAGLFVLQSICLVLAHAASAEPAIASFLRARKAPLQSIAARITEFASQLGSEGERQAALALAASPLFS